MAERLQIMKCDDKEEKVMFHEEYTALCNAGVAKNNLLKKNPLGYFISSMVAGMFISFGSMVAFVLDSRWMEMVQRLR